MTAPGPIVPPSPALPTAPGITYVPEGYWIASSHHCRQSEPHGCSCGDLEFFYRACDGATQQLNRDAFHASMPPGTPVCIVVHGSFTNWKGLCDDCGPVYRWLRSAAPSRTVNVVFYTWPSDGPITYEPHIDVAILGMRASFNSVYLGDLVARIPSGHPVCIMGHSHGARMAAAALHLLGGGDVDGTHLTYLPPPDQRIRCVLVAGALDHQWLDPGQRFGLALCRVESLLYMRNDHDMVLNIYPMRRFFSRRALGEEGLSRRDHERLGTLNTKIVQLDVTHVIHTGHMWNNYYIHPELATAIEPYVYFDDAPAGFVPTADANALDASTALANRSPERQKRRSFLPSFRSRSVKPTSAESVTSSTESER
jgi:Alpha/beta hydrolase family